MAARLWSPYDCSTIAGHSTFHNRYRLLAGRHSIMVIIIFIILRLICSNAILETFHVTRTFVTNKLLPHLLPFYSIFNETFVAIVS